MSQESHNELLSPFIKKADDLISSLPDFSRRFFQSLRLQNMSERTVLQYAYDINKFLDYLKSSAGFKSIDFSSASPEDVLDKLTIDDINEYLYSLRTVHDSKGNIKTASPSYMARQASSLRSFFKFYHENGLISSGVAELIKIPKQHKKNVVCLDSDGVTRLLESVDKYTPSSPQAKSKQDSVRLRDKAILMVLFGTGIRVSELAGIDVKDLDLMDASIVVSRKGGGEDKVYFSGEVEDVLREYIVDCRDGLNKLHIDNGPLFLSNQGTRLTVSSIQKLVKKYSQIAGINIKVTPHTLRRTSGTNLYEETGDLYLVSNFLNHKNPQTTANFYINTSESKRRSASKSLSIFKKDAK